MSISLVRIKMWEARREAFCLVLEEIARLRSGLFLEDRYDRHYDAALEKVKQWIDGQIELLEAE